jgi:hypothetical protein
LTRETCSDFNHQITGLPNYQMYYAVRIEVSCRMPPGRSTSRGAGMKRSITGSLGLAAIVLRAAMASAQATSAAPAQPAPAALPTPAAQAAPAAQTASPAPPILEPLPDMQAVAQALGVTCDFCHGRNGTAAAAADGGRPKKEIAFEMIVMTRELNARVQGVTGKSASTTTRIECVTCHRGVSIPKQLTDIIAQTVVQKGAEAAVAQYRDLRTRYYGSQSYDFTEAGMLNIAQRVIERRPDAAIALLRLNLEYYPQSHRSYMAIAYAYTRKSDDESAIAHLEKALEIQPENGMARGQLEQLKQYRRRR